MNQQDPNPLNYRSPHRDDPYTIRPRPRSHGKHFSIGLATGSLISVIYWPLLWNSIDHGNSTELLWLLPAAKIIAAIVFLSFAGKRAIGAGLLISLIVGFMIFYGTCAYHLP